MRQIYNTAESPDMAIFQMLDMMPSSGNGDTTSTPTQLVYVAPKQLEAANGQSSIKNPSRLSLANLLPSRLENDLNFYYNFLSSFIILPIFEFLSCTRALMSISYSFA